MPQLQVEEVRGMEGFAQLEPLWDTLCRTAECESFFLSHAWFRCCLTGLAPDCEPLTLVVRERSAIVGIAPLLLQKSNWRMFPARLVSLMHNQDSPFSDLIALRERKEPVLRAIIAHLHARPGWDLWAAPRVDRTSTTSHVLTSVLSGGASVRLPSGRSSILQLDTDWNTFWSAQSQRFKKTVRNVANRIERLGAIEIRDEAATEAAPHCIDVFRAVAAKSWKADLPISVIVNPHVARFFEALTATLCAARRLALWVLRLDGKPIATEYHVRDGRTVYALRSDFDERDREVSPGAHLNAFIVRAYFDQGVPVYDMGPGDRDYKQRWATAATERDTFWLFNRTPYAKALYTMERRAVPPLRRAREWWRGSGDGEHLPDA